MTIDLWNPEMILLTAAIGLAAIGFLVYRIRDTRCRPDRGTAAYWLDAIEGGSPVMPKNSVR